ncbi:hypothetical protein GGF32_000871 [Allomyces javanicus]|nr:hypothetical protein GGF32_000871 [Allomyces javanicus]
MLPNVTTFRIKLDWYNQEVVIPAIPEMPQCRVLELVGYPDFAYNPMMLRRFAQCLTRVESFTLGILAQLRHAMMPPSVLTWLLGKSLEDGEVEELVAPCMPLLAPNLTHLRLAPWGDEDQVRWCHALMDLTSLVLLTGDDEQEED